MGIKISTDEIKYIGLFESMTGATVKDCIFEDNKNKIVYVVKEGDMGLAIGKNGANAQRVKETLNKPIDIIEYYYLMISLLFFYFTSYSTISSRICAVFLVVIYKYAFNIPSDPDAASYSP